MGYKLASQVQDQWSHLDHGPFRLLIGIALALPEDSTRCWFGRDRYAQLLGKALASDADRDNAYKSVQRTIKALVNANALRPISAAKPGRTAVYQIIFNQSHGGRSPSTIGPLMGDVQCPPLGGEWGTLSDPNGGRSPSPMVDVERPEWGTVIVPLKKKEEESQEVTKNAPRVEAADLDQEFGAWYLAYPKHVARKAALDAYIKARTKGATVEDLLRGAQRYASERKGQEPKYTKAPASWLNQECWTDEPAQPKANSPWTAEFHKAIPAQYAWANQ